MGPWQGLAGTPAPQGRPHPGQGTSQGGGDLAVESRVCDCSHTWGQPQEMGLTLA